ncbi:PorT family protein [Pontibacter sp. KCTC 32443]|uniref:porin family protein n=1 Tax=Pontibacter TaxID=323449 RepID=UPI00164E67C1|nr:MULTISPECIES: porin family protein [Pontibacter]MBC5772923.1 PorT family protein [Pontibacter sp. KCTC 32443]
MKIKFLLALLFVVGLGFTSMAQSISVGPRVGATFAKISIAGDDSDEFNEEIKSNAGVQIGAVANVMINDMFSIQPELLLVQKGFKVGEDGDFMKVKTNYLELPVLAKVNFGTEELHGFVTAGPTAGYLMNGKMKMEFDGEEEEEDLEFEDEDNRLELGASFGVGLGYKVGAGTLNLDVRYGLGISSLYETEGDEEKTRNRVFGVSVAYLFGL